VRLTLAYGTAGMAVEVPDGRWWSEPREPDPLEDEAGAVRARAEGAILGPASRRPHRDRRPGRGGLPRRHPTHAQHHRAAARAGRARFDRGRSRPGRAAVRHRYPPHRHPEEMAALVGPAVMARYRVHQHVADDGDHVRVGRWTGRRSCLDRRYVEADVRILTGFVEPHFFAGWSGGPKGVCPGLAATATILEAHSPARIADARPTWMVTEDNPVHAFVRAATALCPPQLSLDVTIDSGRRLTGVFAGVLPDAHRAACRSPPMRSAAGGRVPSTWCSRPTGGTRSTATSTSR
jgi:hypothetical protein